MLPVHKCPGPLSRRQWLSVGGLSLGALASGGLPGLAGLLAAESSAPQLSRDFSVILFWANGGPSHIDIFDLKPQAPLEYRGPFRPIRTNVPGMEISELLPRLARCADKFALLRSLHHERAEHSGGSHRFLTGYPSKAANLNVSEYPDIGSIVAHQLAGQPSPVPPFVANTQSYGCGPGYLGPSYAPYMPSPNPISASGENEYDPIPIYPTAKSKDSLSISTDGVMTLRRREGLLKTLDRLPSKLDESGSMSALDSFQQRAMSMLASERTRLAFDLTRESEPTRERYGETHWGKSLLTCRRLVEAGVRFVQCQAEFRLRPETGVTSSWDDHAVNCHIFQASRKSCPCSISRFRHSSRTSLPAASTSTCSSSSAANSVARRGSATARESPAPAATIGPGR